ncbi:MAG TPA: cytochrome c [Mucilaginibacter sp.]|jgi:mono/diheme cytochrome c family protein|nr:cytochrome c [Mucilaginibacter sp.]
MKIKVIFGICGLLLALIISCQSGETLEFDRYYSEGAVIYQKHCQNCHGAHGQGLNGLIPPLNDSAFFKTDRHQLPCLVQYGLKSKINIGKRDFEGQMPAAGDLANIEIAQVITYITNSFGNKMGVFNVDTVNNDLQQCR